MFLVRPQVPQPTDSPVACGSSKTYDLAVDRVTVAANQRQVRLAPHFHSAFLVLVGDLAWCPEELRFLVAGGGYPKYRSNLAAPQPLAHAANAGKH